MSCSDLPAIRISTFRVCWPYSGAGVLIHPAVRLSEGKRHAGGLESARGRMLDGLPEPAGIQLLIG